VSRCQARGEQLAGDRGGGGLLPGCGAENDVTAADWPFVELANLLARSDSAKDAERNAGAPRLSCADRAILAALARLLPRHRSASYAWSPPRGPCCGGTRS